MSWDESRDDYRRIQNDEVPKNESSFGHELLAGGAAFAGFKAFEDHQRKEGKPVSHAFAKELLAGFAAAEVDKLAETKGADWVDRERAKHEAKKRAENMYDDQYSGREEFHPDHEPHGHLRDHFGW
jgi:hypothetical protein